MSDRPPPRPGSGHQRRHSSSDDAYHGLGGEGGTSESDLSLHRLGLGYTSSGEGDDSECAQYDEEPYVGQDDLSTDQEAREAHAGQQPLNDQVPAGGVPPARCAQRRRRRRSRNVGAGGGNVPPNGDDDGGVNAPDIQAQGCIACFVLRKPCPRNCHFIRAFPSRAEALLFTDLKDFYSVQFLKNRFDAAQRLGVEAQEENMDVKVRDSLESIMTGLSNNDPLMLESINTFDNVLQNSKRMEEDIIKTRKTLNTLKNITLSLFGATFFEAYHPFNLDLNLSVDNSQWLFDMYGDMLDRFGDLQTMVNQGSEATILAPITQAELPHRDANEALRVRIDVCGACRKGCCFEGCYFKNAFPTADDGRDFDDLRAFFQLKFLRERFRQFQKRGFGDSKNLRKTLNAIMVGWQKNPIHGFFRAFEPEIARQNELQVELNVLRNSCGQYVKRFVYFSKMRTSKMRLLRGQT